MKNTIKIKLGVISRDIVTKVIRCDYSGPRVKEINFNDNLRKKEVEKGKMTKVQQDTNRAKLHEGQGKKLQKERRIGTVAHCGWRKQ